MKRLLAKQQQEVGACRAPAHTHSNRVLQISARFDRRSDLRTPMMTVGHVLRSRALFFSSVFS